MAGYEAQKLISISLGKIAASRVGRAGTSLHKSLLVATVLHKARHVFMEESYSIYYHQQQQQQQQQPRVGVLPSPSQVVVNPSAAYHQDQHHYAHQGEYCEYYPPQPSCSAPSTPPAPQGAQVQQEAKPQGSSTTQVSTASSSSSESTTTTTTSSSSEPIYQDVTDDEDEDKENQTDCVPTYLDLDACSTRTRSNSTTPLGDASNTVASRKRRRPISDQETQEAVSSILPKKSKKETARSDVELRALPPPIPCYRSDDDDGGEADTECGPDDDDDDDEEDSDTESNAMEVEHITSLVSIFSFGGMGTSGGSGSSAGRVGGASVVRTVSSPDMCSTQANKDPLDVVQRPVLALTV